MTTTATTPAIRLVGLHTGMPRHLGQRPDGEPFISSIGRTGVERPIALAIEGFEGDACQYRGHHGLNMAINAFADEHYAWFGEQAGRPLPRPAFGENLTLAGYTEEEARIGDRLSLGSALVEVTQPREPCSNVALFHKLPRIVKWMASTGRTGYYLRVIEAGVVDPASPIEMVERGDAEWTIARLNRAMFGGDPQPEQTYARLTHHPRLSENWLRSWRKQLDRRRAHPTDADMAGA